MQRPQELVRLYRLGRPPVNVLSSWNSVLAPSGHIGPGLRRRRNPVASGSSTHDQGLRQGHAGEGTCHTDNASMVDPR